MSKYTPAPLLKPLRAKGGTYYTFSAAANQYSKTLFDSNIKIAPSAFICLKLPSWNNMSNSQKLWRNPADFGPPITTDPNVLFPKVLQNYTENFVQYSYAYRNRPNELKTVAEMAFWKTLRMLGAISFVEKAQITLGGQVYPVLEEDTAAYPNYEKVIKYVGEANILNHVSKGGQSYTEVMLHVPVTAGFHDSVKFLNCGIEFSLNELPDDAGEETVGLEEHDNENNKAIFDTVYRTYTVGNDLDNATVWFDGTKADTEKANKGDFSFNAILVYYDIWDVANPTVVARNLHGILLLDNFKDAGGGSYAIECFDKLMPSTDNAGNAYVSNINMKLSNASNQVTSEITINDYDNVSMILYVDALKRLTDVTERFLSLSEDYISLKNQVDAMSAMLKRIEPNEELQSQISSIQNQLIRNQTEERISNEELLELFEKTLKATSSSDHVDIKMFVGALSLDEAGNIYVNVGNTKYVYDTVSKAFTVYSGSGEIPYLTGMNKAKIEITNSQLLTNRQIQLLPPLQPNQYYCVMLCAMHMKSYSEVPYVNSEMNIRYDSDTAEKASVLSQPLSLPSDDTYVSSVIVSGAQSVNIFKKTGSDSTINKLGSGVSLETQPDIAGGSVSDVIQLELYYIIHTIQ